MFFAASRIATISPCAVGSFVFVTEFTPFPIISPFLTINAPNGPPPDFAPSVANSIRLFIAPPKQQISEFVFTPCYPHDNIVNDNIITKSIRLIVS